MARYRKTGNEDGSRNITLFLNGDIFVTDDQNPRFDEICDRIENDDLDGITDLFEPEAAIRNAFAQLSADVAIENGVVLYRGESINDVLSDHIVKLWDADEEFLPVVRFLERLHNNPNPNSVDRLWQWISDRHLKLTCDGKIVGYKGLTRERKSKRAGYGDFRNGQPVEGHILHNPGDVIEKARDKVVFDVNIGCAEGLHVGDFSYANSWGEVVVEVEVDPADVVSVPEDDSRKMRVCRYRVRDIVKEESKDFFVESWTAMQKADDRPNITINFDGGLVGDPKRQASAVIDVLQKSDKFKQNQLRNMTVNANVPVDTPKRVKVDTRKNHVYQQRDSRGRFIKKGK